MLIFLLTLLAALGSGLVAGLLFAFSNFVMQALAQLRDEEGAAAMQNINVTIINPIFMLIFFGPAVLSVALLILPAPQMPARSATFAVAGGLLYLAGTVGVTMIFNVPMNNQLENVDLTDASSLEYWQIYVPQWMRWNHVRTIAAVLATVAFILALSVR